MGYLNSQSVKELLAKKYIGIYPYINKFQGPNLYYCHLGESLLKPKKGRLADTNKLDSDLYEEFEINEFYDLMPNEFVLAETYEKFMTDKKHAIRLFNSSSLARLGVVQCAAGMINPGCGTEAPIRVTLELYNSSPFTIRLYPTKENAQTGKISSWGTEVLKIGIISHEEVHIEYEDWEGGLYGKHGSVKGSLIDRRFK